MIPAEREAEILRLYHAERWRIGTIATQLGIHHSAVERVVRHSGLLVTKILPPSIADPYVPFIIETLEKYPKLCASRLFDMVKERGYPGRPDHFRAVVARYRPRPEPEAGDAPHLAAVHQILERHRHERGQAPPIAVLLPDNPRVRNLVVQPHPLGAYDALATRHTAPKTAPEHPPEGNEHDHENPTT